MSARRGGRYDYKAAIAVINPRGVQPFHPLHSAVLQNDNTPPTPLSVDSKTDLNIVLVDLEKAADPVAPAVFSLVKRLIRLVEERV